ncbi:MAG: anti-sigma factor antagonist [Frankiales bacterium]|nr:anti-sigma factor antagonist [Frankiales bacterium]
MASAAVHVTASGSGRVVVVSLIGEHDLASAEHLRRTLLELSSHVSLIVLDFDQATFVDSSVLGVFAGACKRAARHGNCVIGVNAKGIVLRAMTMTGVDALLSMPVPVGELEDELDELLHHTDP